MDCVSACLISIWLGVCRTWLVAGLRRNHNTPRFPVPGGPHLSVGCLDPLSIVRVSGETHFGYIGVCEQVECGRCLGDVSTPAFQGERHSEPSPDDTGPTTATLNRPQLCPQGLVPNCRRSGDPSKCALRPIKTLFSAREILPGGGRGSRGEDSESWGALCEHEVLTTFQTS